MAWRRLQGLRTRLFWLVFLTLVPAIVLHVVSALEKRHMARLSAEDNLKSITDLAAANAQMVLINSGEVLHGLTRLPGITALDTPTAEQLLNRAKEIFPNFTSITVLRPDGSIAASTISTNRDVNFADRPWIQQAMTTKTPAITGVQFGKRTGQPAIILAHPLLNAQGELLGVCTLALRLHWFSEIFEKKRMPYAAEAELFDEHGLVLATWPDNPQRIGTLLPNRETILTHATGAPDATYSGPGPNGVPYRFVIASVRSEAPTSLFLRLGVPAENINNPLDMALWRDMLGLGLTVALAFVAAHLFSRVFVLRPTGKLVQMATAMAGGDLDRRSGLAAGHGEMADLGRALDAMADTLRERIRFTQEIIDAIPAPIFYKDREGRYLGCNTAYEQNIRSLTQNQGQTLPPVELPEYFGQCLATDRTALASPGRTIEYETEIKYQDKEIHNVIVFKSIFNNADGAAAGIVGVILDITARKHSELACLASETKYRALLASMRDGFVVVAQNDHLVDSNPAFREMLGYSAEELARMTYQDITPSPWHAPEEQILRSTVDTRGFSEVFEKEYRRKDSSTFPVALRLHRYPSLANDKCRYFAIARDITDVKTIENALRTAKETAEKANRAKSDFLAKMSHEIRTPLHAVIGMTELTLGTPLSLQQRDALETVREAAGNLLEIINDILDISRIEARKLELFLEDFDLHRTLASIVRTLHPQAQRKGLSLTLTVDPKLPRFVRSDQGRLRQILLNLIGNALKFTETGSVTITAQAGIPQAVLPPGGALLELTVTDTGVGIVRDRLERIFEMFTQADAMVSRQYGGTGLGLAICRELTRLMGGNIEAESTPGQGSRFRVRLPMAPAQTTPQSDKETALPAASQTGKPLRILLAEDNPVNIKVATTYLSRHNHQTMVATDGWQALKQLAEHPFDLVLMDVEMPNLDGLDTTRKLRAGEAGPKNQTIPVIAMTAHALSGSKERCLNAGMTGYLPKPLDFQDLDALLARTAAETVESAPVTPPPSTLPSPATPPASLSLDTPAALQRLGGDATLLREIESDFLRQYPRKLRIIVLCSDNENWSEAALAAHSLKNIAGAVGAENARLLAGRLEDCLRHAEAGAASEVLAALTKSLHDADAAIKTLHTAPPES